MSSRVHEAVKAIALCHNVTPVYEARGAATETEFAEADQDFSDDNRTYQASSPDEVSGSPSLMQTLPSHHPEAWGLDLGMRKDPYSDSEQALAVAHRAIQSPPGVTPALPRPSTPCPHLRMS